MRRKKMSRFSIAYCFLLLKQLVCSFRFLEDRSEVEHHSLLLAPFRQEATGVMAETAARGNLDQQRVVLEHGDVGRV